MVHRWCKWCGALLGALAAQEQIVRVLLLHYSKTNRFDQNRETRAAYKKRKQLAQSLKEVNLVPVEKLIMENGNGLLPYSVGLRNVFHLDPA